MRNWLINILETVINNLRTSKNGKIHKEKPSPIKKPIIPIPEKVYKIGLSPGHGGQDLGAKGSTGKREATIARQVCQDLEKAFSKNIAFDVKVYGFIEDVKNYPKRVKESNAHGDDYYIPIHLNAFSSKTKNGWLIFVDPADLEKSGNKLKNLCINILITLHKQYPIGWGDWDSSPKNRDGFMAGIGRKVYEQSKPNADTVYLELGYITNPEWEKLITMPEHSKKISDLIVQGFEDSLGLRKFRID